MSSTETPENVVIVGGGPAGYTAALYAARAGLRPVCVEGFDSGGQISRSYLVENFPGVPDGTSGADLAARIREQAEAFGAQILLDEVVEADLDSWPFALTLTDGTLSARSLVVATGSRPRSLGLAGEEALVGRGIAYCALCDGALFAGKKVVVVGGGNAALGESIAMARVASEVSLVHRRHTFRADAVVVEATRTTPGVTLLAPFVVEEVVPDDAGLLCGVKVRDLDTGETSYLETSGLFVAIGHEPELGVFASYLEIENGHVVTAAGSTATSVPGVFAAGDVADSRYRQAVTAAASGCMAAVDAERWLVATDGGTRRRLREVPTLHV